MNPLSSLELQPGPPTSQFSVQYQLEANLWLGFQGFVSEKLLFKNIVCSHKEDGCEDYSHVLLRLR